MKTLFTPLLLGLATSFALPALAGPQCTQEPRSTWLSAEAMRARFTAEGYKDDVRALHVSKGQCWEIYGHDRQGRAVEVYFHPITGAIVEQNVRR